MEVLDITEGCSYPASDLSNFTPYDFVVDGIPCASMEGFLQSLKFSDSEKQKQICLLVGKQAKFKGKKKKWFITQTLYWQGKEMNRHSLEYQLLLDRAFESLAKNPTFQQVLFDTGKAILRHSMGKTDPTRTILTEDEFCQRLMKLRDK